MSRLPAKKRAVELRYEFGFRTPGKKDLVICGSLEDARFFVANGATLMMREIETRATDWTEVEGS